MALCHHTRLGIARWMVGRGGAKRKKNTINGSAQHYAWYPVGYRAVSCDTQADIAIPKQVSQHGGPCETPPVPFPSTYCPVPYCIGAVLNTLYLSSLSFIWFPFLYFSFIVLLNLLFEFSKKILQIFLAFTLFISYYLQFHFFQTKKEIKKFYEPFLLQPSSHIPSWVLFFLIPKVDLKFIKIYKNLKIKNYSKNF